MWSPGAANDMAPEEGLDWSSGDLGTSITSQEDSGSIRVWAGFTVNQEAPPEPGSPTPSQNQSPHIPGMRPPLSPSCTLAHSLARCLVRLALRSSAYKAPMKEPMEVPPTRSTGTPASSKAFSTPMCEQPLQGGGDPRLAEQLRGSTSEHLHPPWGPS